MITVYTLPNCTECRATKIALRKQGIGFDEVDLSQDDEARAKVRDEWGFTSAPVVSTPFDQWSGFRPEKIKELKNDLGA